MSLRDTYRAFLEDLLPHGSFWRGPAIERFLDALTDASLPLVTFLAELHTKAWPFDAERAVLEQWYNYLQIPTCTAIPADTEDLRDLVKAALATEDLSSPDGLFDWIYTFLPLVDLDDIRPVSGPPLSVPFAVNADAHALDVWHSPTVYSETLIECVARPYAPAAAIIRPVAPIAEFRHPVPANKRADAVALDWAHMWAPSTVLVKRFLEPAHTLIEQAEPAISEQGPQTLDQLFPLLSPASVMTNQQIEATFRHTTQGGVVEPLAVLIYTF